jgi:hypothetical protein
MGRLENSVASLPHLPTDVKLFTANRLQIGLRHSHLATQPPSLNQAPHT